MNIGSEAYSFWVSYSVQDSTGTWWDVPAQKAWALQPGESGAIQMEWSPPETAPTGAYNSKVALWKHRDYDTGLMEGEFDRRTKEDAFRLNDPGGVDGVIIFPDPNLEAVVRAAIDKSDGPIYVADLEQIKVPLNAAGNDIEDLTGLEYCTNLQYLALGNNQITDVSPLARLTNLETLGLEDNQITDVSPLERLTNLQSLYLENNQITDVSPLAGLTNLQILWLGDNHIIDVSPLAGLTNLDILYLCGNQITDVSPLADLTNLEILYLGRNQITDVSPLAGLTNLHIYT
jgi:hypothetical protein